MAWHCIGLDNNINSTFILPDILVDVELGGVVLYCRIPFESTLGISVLRLSWVQCKGGSI
jgi:hypothetical protein